MRLINRCGLCISIRRPSYSWMVVAIVVLGHLALFQLVDASTSQSTPSSVMSLLLGNGMKNAFSKGRCRGQDVISLVPEKDREVFLFYHLAQALNSLPTDENAISFRAQIKPQIPAKISKTFKDIRTYDTFSTDLLKWTMQTFEWSQFDVHDLLLRRYRKLCTSKGLCFSPNDIGSMCCPF